MNPANTDSSGFQHTACSLVDPEDDAPGDHVIPPDLLDENSLGAGPGALLNCLRAAELMTTKETEKMKRMASVSGDFACQSAVPTTFAFS